MTSEEIKNMSFEDFRIQLEVWKRFRNLQQMERRDME